MGRTDRWPCVTRKLFVPVVYHVSPAGGESSLRAGALQLPYHWRPAVLGTAEFLKLAGKKDKILSRLLRGLRESEDCLWSSLWARPTLPGPGKDGHGPRSQDLSAP